MYKIYLITKVGSPRVTSLKQQHFFGLVLHTVFLCCDSDNEVERGCKSIEPVWDSQRQITNSDDNDESNSCVARHAMFEMIFGQSQNSATTQRKCVMKCRVFSQCLSDYKDTLSETKKISNRNKNLTEEKNTE